MMTKNSAYIFYEKQIETLAASLQKLRSQGRWWLGLKIACFLLFLLLLLLYFFRTRETGIIVASLLFAAGYVVVYLLDVKNEKQTNFIQRRLKAYGQEISGLQGDYSCFDAGTDFVDAHHPYTFDLDIFGSKSLFQQICRTVTTGGRRELAKSLQQPLSSIEEMETRRNAVDELAKQPEWRNRFVALSTGIDSRRIEAALLQLNQHKTWFSSPLILPLVFCSVALLFAGIVLAVFSVVSSFLPVDLFFLQFTVTLVVAQKRLTKLSQTVSPVYSELRPYVSLLRHLSTTEFQSDELRRLQRSLFGKDDALQAFRDLSVLTGSIDRRGNLLGLLVSDGFFCNDLFIVRRMERWIADNAGKMSAWLQAVSKIDALVSLATFRFNHPEATEAEFVDSPTMVYRAEGLYHPFLSAEKAVRNDFEIRDGHIYIITGANMAGKSTFLRSLGINYLLATIGLPVFADRFRVSVFALFSSMRTDDNLTSGISYFNAELLRLQQLIAYCRQHPHTLIILDEILKGTNSADKLSGSKLFLESILHLPVSGVIATHDLALSKLEETDEHFENYCFEIELSAHIHYSYHIQKGVARNMNATYLLKNILKDCR